MRPPGRELVPCRFSRASARSMLEIGDAHGNGETDLDAQPRPWVQVGKTNRAVQDLNHPPHDRQPKATSLVGLRPAIEALENLLLQSRRYTRTLIANLDRQTAAGQRAVETYD